MPPPRRARIGVVPGLRYSEQGLSRGNRPRSSSRTDAPARARSSAVVAPAGPAPTTTTSQRSVTTAPRSGRRAVRAEHGRGRADERRREVHAVVVHPSPTPRESHRLVAHARAALEPRVTCGTLILALPRVAARAPALRELREDATGEEERGEQREPRPAEAPRHAGPHGAGRDEPAGGEPLHSSNSSSRIRRFRSAGAPWARQRARRKPRNSFSKSNTSPHGGQSVRC